MTSKICQKRWCTYITMDLNPAGNRVTLSHLHPPTVRNDATDRVRGAAKWWSQWLYVFPTHFKITASVPFHNGVKCKMAVGCKGAGWLSSGRKRHLPKSGVEVLKSRDNIWRVKINWFPCSLIWNTPDTGTSTCCIALVQFLVFLFTFVVHSEVTLVPPAPAHITRFQII
jgi:hypothetical protein